MDERNILLRYLGTQTLYLLYKDFYSNKISNNIQIKHGLSEWQNRRVTNVMVLDDDFWAVLKTTSTYRALKKEAAYKRLLYNSRREAYDLVRKDALANAKSND